MTLCRSDNHIHLTALLLRSALGSTKCVCVCVCVLSLTSWVLKSALHARTHARAHTHAPARREEDFEEQDPHRSQGDPHPCLQCLMTWMLRIHHLYPWFLYICNYMSISICVYLYVYIYMSISICEYFLCISICLYLYVYIYRCTSICISIYLYLYL